MISLLNKNIDYYLSIPELKNSLNGISYVKEKYGSKSTYGNLCEMDINNPFNIDFSFKMDLPGGSIGWYEFDNKDFKNGKFSICLDIEDNLDASLKYIYKYILGKPFNKNFLDIYSNYIKYNPIEFCVYASRNMDNFRLFFSPKSLEKNLKILEELAIEPPRAFGGILKSLYPLYTLSISGIKDDSYGLEFPIRENKENTIAILNSIEKAFDVSLEYIKKLLNYEIMIEHIKFKFNNGNFETIKIYFNYIRS